MNHYVYCEGCVFKKIKIDGDYCTHQSNKKCCRNYNYEWLENSSCYSANKNNNCQYFEYRINIIDHLMTWLDKIKSLNIRIQKI